jgi:hypothetical protein
MRVGRGAANSANTEDIEVLFNISGPFVARDGEGSGPKEKCLFLTLQTR